MKHEIKVRKRTEEQEFELCKKKKLAETRKG